MPFANPFQALFTNMFIGDGLWQKRTCRGYLLLVESHQLVGSDSSHFFFLELGFRGVLGLPFIPSTVTAFDSIIGYAFLKSLPVQLNRLLPQEDSPANLCQSKGLLPAAFFFVLSSLCPVLSVKKSAISST